MITVMKKYRSIFIIIITMALICYGIGYYLNTELNKFVVNLSEKITEQIGHPVKIGKVTNSWDWLYLKINITDFQVADKQTNIPLFSASSIVGTVDAVQSVLNLNLKFKNLLLRNPKLVLHWDMINKPTILGLNGENVEGHIDPKILLRLLSMQRKINLESGSFNLRGVKNATLPFTNVTLDFIEKSKYEYNLVIRGDIDGDTQPEFNFAMNYLGDLNEFYKSMIDFELKTSKVKLSEVINFIPGLKQNLISGDFKDLDIKGTVQNSTLRNIRTNFVIDNIRLNKDTIISAGEGKLEFRPFRNKYSFAMSNLKISNNNLFSYPLNIDSMRGEIISERTADGLSINTDDLELKILDLKFKTALKMHLKDDKVELFDLEGKFSDAFIEKVLILLPDNVLNEKLNEWLNKSLIDGLVDNIKVQHQAGQTFCSVALKQAELQYSTEWPSIHNVDAQITLENGMVLIESERADILKNKVNSVVAKFPVPFDTKKSVISIIGDMDTSLEAGLDFLNKTPLKANVADKMQKFKPAGKIHLDLKLGISLNEYDKNVAVDGDIKLQHATIVTPNIDLPLTDLNGDINFSNKTLKADNLELALFNNKATAKIYLDEAKDEGLQISVATPIDIEDLKQNYKNLKLDKISGKTNIVATLSLPWHADSNQKILTITSDLDGITLDYPVPLRKVAATKLPLHLKYFINDDNTDNLYLTLAKLVDTNFVIKDGNIQGGNISFGAGNAVLADTDNLVISGKIDRLNSEDWQPLFIENKIFNSLPIEMELLVDKLYFNGNKWNDMWVKYDSKTNKWALENPLIKGTFHFVEEGKIDVKLDNLELETENFKNHSFLDYIHNKSKENKLPLIQFYCENLCINKKDYHKISFQLLPRIYGYEIMEFSISNENILLQAQGQWQMLNKEFTLFSGNAFTKNFGKALENWGYTNSIARGDGEINFSVQWDGDPSKFDILKLEGASHIDLRSGSLTGVNPGLGRVIGLLSFESIQRRLQLDFSDLLSKGFAFDKLSSDLKLRPGSASSENILINGPSARIELSGKTDLKSQDLDFTMFVTPKVGAGLPIAAAIAAGNPAVGAAIWLFDKASGSKISEISKYQYKVTGTWNAPKIDEVIVKKERKDDHDNDNGKGQ